MRFEIDDTVKISKKSTFYNVMSHDDSNNPYNKEGKIIEINMGQGLPIKVRWDVHMTNTYDEHDLGLVMRG